MTLKVKVMRRPDMKALAAIHMASFYKGWNAAYIAESLRVPGTLALVARGYAGFALLRIAGGLAHIVTLAVCPESRGQGVGNALLEALLAQARRHKANETMLKVNERNDAAIRLYRRHGFTQAARHKAHYSNPGGMRSDALVMQRSL